MRRILQLALTLLITASFSTVFGQGTTTSALNGQVVDANGSALPGATVLAVHTPTGSQYGNVSDVEGYFRISGMQVGGPYTVTISFVGYKPYQQSGVFLTLGQTFRIKAVLEEESTQLEGVEIIASANDVFDGNKTGQSTIIDEESINELPTVSRSLVDFTRLNPLVNTQGDAIEIAGMNNRYNAIYIDGAVNNDVFGLASSGTNGGQTGVSPISIDAIEQFQVSVAPFDVTQSGFAGGSINAVTRSGTNEFEGSAYYFFRNQNLAGKTPTEDADAERTKLADFTAKTYGFRVGGPIVKNKVFFFANAEMQRDETPQPFNASSYIGDASTADIQALVNKLKSDYGYDPGTYTNNAATLNSDKFLAKIDWNLSQNHKLSVRHSYVKAENLQANRSNSSTINFENGSVFFPSTTNSTALELKSNFGGNMSNHLTIGATFVNDDRDPAGASFPYVGINDGDGFIQFGSEQFSTANQLKQDVITVTDNFQIFKGKHTFTIGTHNEFYKTYNLFIRQAFGAYQYDSLSGFMNDLNARQFDVSYSLVDDVVGDGSAGAAEFTGMQLGVYGQDEFQASDKLKLTLGLRVDIPIFNDNTLENADFNSNAVSAIEAQGYDLKGAKTGEFIGASVLFAPRFGFNYDVTGDRSTQLRGGAGIFNSRIPLVWPGGAYNNNGLTVGGDRSFNVPFNPNWDEQPRNVAPGQGAPSGQIDLFASDFKLPQVFKVNVGVDQKLPWGMVGSFEALFSKFLNNVFYQNLNIKPSTTRLTGSPDDRILYNRRDAVDGTYTGIYLGSNTSKGYTYNLAASVSKPFSNGFTTTLSYTWNDAFSVYDGTSSQNSSQWRGLHSVNGRNFFDEAPRSDFSMGSRVIAQVSYRKEYFGFGASQISLFYNGQSGRVYSYIYNDSGNLTNEDSRERSLVYIPATQNDINLVDYTSGGTTVTAAQQWSDLDAFIKSDKYLSEHRGEYADRNQSRSPFEGVVDFRFLQDFYIQTASGKRNTLQVSLDIFNLTNLVNKDWGRRYFVSDGGNFQSAELLNFQSFQADGTTPTFTYRKGADYQPWQIDDSGFQSSRWQMQIGVRYIFK
ncbi:TonB-dependent receptor [uncultured Imperialibacter sp.]|uniref:TonB-dependent receptor n=1 Tax=uncultured Imperialibacter sp. TaxID=1672639 RepID=UPI0030D7FA79|tara:strand:+ start:3046 stop:6273 length:3228 start_codon:yes stop_codon:yes gene_type:complete